MKKFINIIPIISIVLICLSAASCKKEEPVVEVQQAAPVVEKTKPQKEPEPEPVKPKFAKFDSAYDFTNTELSTAAFHTDAHSEFLDDPMEFSEIPTQDITEGQTAVVCREQNGIWQSDLFDEAR